MIHIVRLSVAVLLVVVICASGVSAQWLPGQVVTWSNFNFVNGVAASMSHVYFATTNGLIRYNKMEQRWEDPLTGADGLQNEIPARVWVDQFDTQLFIKTDVSYYQYDSLFERWYPITSLPEIDNPAEHVPTPNTLLPDFNANYVGNNDFVDTHGRRWSVTDAVDDQTGTLWLGTWGFGGAEARTATGITDLLPYGLLQTRVGTIVRRDSILWLGGPVYDDYRTGVTGFNPTTDSFQYVESGLQQDFPRTDINCLDVDSARLYIGTPQGLFLISRTSQFHRRQLDQGSGLSDDNVLAVKAVGDLVYVGTAAGLTLINQANDSVAYIRNETFSDQLIYDIEPDGGSVWIASSVGAYRYTPSTDRLQRYSDPELVLSSTVFNVEIYGGSIWFVSNDGLVRLDKKTGDHQVFREVASQPDYRALAVTDSVAAVTSDLGLTLIYLNGQDSYSHEYSARDGLPSNVVYSLLFDGDYLWVGTDRGLTRFWWNNPQLVR